MTEEGTQASSPMTARQRNKEVLGKLPALGLLCGSKTMLPDTSGDAPEGVTRMREVMCGGMLRLMAPMDVCVIHPEGDLYEVAGVCPECGARQRVYFNLVGEAQLGPEAMPIVQKLMGAKPGQAPDKPVEKKPESKLAI